MTREKDKFNGPYLEDRIRDGLSLEQISVLTGLSRRAISARISRYQKPVRVDPAEVKPNGAGPRGSALLEMMESGMSSERIAEATGLTRNSVMGRISREKGIQGIPKKKGVSTEKVIDIYSIGPRMCRYISGPVKTVQGKVVARMCGKRTRELRSFCDLHHAICYNND